MKPCAFLLAGALLWAVACVLLRPSPFDAAWAHLLLMLAPLVLAPLGLQLIERVAQREMPLVRAAVRLQFPAALFLGVAFVLPQGVAAACLSAAWLIVTGLLATAGVLRLARRAAPTLADLTVSAAMVFIFVGGGWAMLDRLGLRPLGFEPVIVLLTAIHFHYAGFVLPLATGLALRALDGPVARIAGVGVIAGVPLVAVGITATQLHWPPWLESVAAVTLAAIGLLAAYLHARLAGQAAWPMPVRCLWALAAASLAASMLLATAYALRFYLPLAWLDIPWMRALHGSANALGFALPCLVGWTAALRRRARHGPCAGTSDNQADGAVSRVCGAF